MYNRLLIFLIFLILPILLISQVNFNLEYSIQKINSNDILIDIISANNNQAIIAGYSNTNENYFRIVKYDSNGNLLSTYEENYLNNEKLSYIYSNFENNIPYLYLGFENEITNEDSLTIELRILSFDDYSLIDSFSYIFDFSQPPSGLNIEISVSISSICCKESNDSSYFYLGTTIDYHEDNGLGFGYEETDHRYSELIAFQKIDDTFEFIENFSNNGLAIFSSDLIISSGFDEYHYLYHAPPIMELVNEYDLFLYVQSETNIPDNLVFHEYVDESSANPHIQILTFEDTSYQDYGTMTYYNQDTTPIFLNFSPDFNSIIWENNNTNFNYSPKLTTFTNIETDLGDHFVIYFYNNQIEIRNRIDGSIVHYETGWLTPFSIIIIDNQKLFITQDQDVFTFYSIDDIIYVSTNECIASQSLFKASNYPNPFNPTTTISFSTKHACRTSLDIYNIKGQKINTLLNKQIDIGNYSIFWDGNDKNDKPVSSGVYFYKLKTEKQEIVKRMLLLK